MHRRAAWFSPQGFSSLVVVVDVVVDEVVEDGIGSNNVVDATAMDVADDAWGTAAAEDTVGCGVINDVGDVGDVGDVDMD